MWSVKLVGISALVIPFVVYEALLLYEIAYYDVGAVSYLCIVDIDGHR
jgi:hypothetical protein